MIWLGLVWLLFNGISIFLGYLIENLSFYNVVDLTQSWEDKVVHNFLKGICLKVTVIARLVFELTYYVSVVRRFNHYTTKTPPEKDTNILIPLLCVKL